MLRATQTVLKSGARNCFYVISTRQGLTDSERRRVREREGNDFVESVRPYVQMMEEAGFVEIEVADVTSEYTETIAGWKSEWEADADAFIELVGEEEFDRRIHNRILDLANAEDGLVQRLQLFGIKP